jgi:hypothetical protein
VRYVKVNWDAAVDKDKMKMSICVIVRGHERGIDNLTSSFIVHH